MRLLRYLPPSAPVIVFILAFVAGKLSAASLLVNSNVVLNPGSYSYDSVTIEPQGTLQLLGDTTITTIGDFTIRSALTTNIFNDPDTGQTVTNYSILSGSIDLDRNEGLSSGTNGAAGADGQAATTNGQITGASPGAPGHSGSTGEVNPFIATIGGYFQGYQLTIRSGHDLNLDGYISVATYLPGGSGGRGGTGGRGGPGYPGTAPTNADYSYIYEGGRGGDGGQGGFGGNGGYFPGGSHLILDAAHNVTMTSNTVLSTISYCSGGSGGWGGMGGYGGSGGGPTLNGRMGDGGNGGAGGDAGRAGRAGDILIQGQTVTLAGAVYQAGPGGGNGGKGGDGGALYGTGTLGYGGRGGNGGNASNGGEGGRLFIRATSVVTNELTIDQSGGLGGIGGDAGAGGFGLTIHNGNPGVPGANGLDGLNGYIVYLDAVAPSPRLFISRSTNGVVLSWPASAQGFSLQQTPSLSSPGWVSVPQQPESIGTNLSVVISPSASATFYRLTFP